MVTPRISQKGRTHYPMHKALLLLSQLYRSVVGARFHRVGALSFPAATSIKRRRGRTGLLLLGIVFIALLFVSCDTSSFSAQQGGQSTTFSGSTTQQQITYNSDANTVLIRTFYGTAKRARATTTVKATRQTSATAKKSAQKTSTATKKTTNSRTKAAQ